MPEWARGKDKRELVSYMDRVIRDVMSTAPAPPAPTPEPSAPAAPAQSYPTAPDPDLHMQNPQEYARQMAAYTQAVAATTLNAASAPVLDSVAQMAKFASQQDPQHASIWRKWGPEIEAMVAANTRYAPGARSRKDLWDQAAAIVKANHVDEIARDMAVQMTTTPTMVTQSPTPSAPTMPSPSADPIAALFDIKPGEPGYEWVASAQEAALTPTMVRDYCKKRGISPATYAEQVKTSGIKRDGHNRWSRDLSRAFGAAHAS